MEVRKPRKRPMPTMTVSAFLRKQLKAYQENKRFGPVLKEQSFDFAAALRKKKPRELRHEIKRADELLQKGAQVTCSTWGHRALSHSPKPSEVRRPSARWAQGLVLQRR